MKLMRNVLKADEQEEDSCVDRKLLDQLLMISLNMKPGQFVLWYRFCRTGEAALVASVMG